MSCDHVRLLVWLYLYPGTLLSSHQESMSAINAKLHATHPGLFRCPISTSRVRTHPFVRHQKNENKEAVRTQPTVNKKLTALGAIFSSCRQLTRICSLPLRSRPVLSPNICPENANQPMFTSSQRARIRLWQERSPKLKERSPKQSLRQAVAMKA